MKTNVILKPLIILFFVGCPRYERVIPVEIKVSLKNVPMPCDENIKYNLLSLLKVNR